MHLVLAPFEPGKEAIQASKFAFWHATLDQFLLSNREFGVGYVDWQVIIVSQRQQLIQLMTVGGRVPGSDGTILEAPRGVGHNKIHVDVNDVAETLTVRAGSQRTVKVEQPRLQLRVLQLALFTSQRAVKPQQLPGPPVNRAGIGGIICRSDEQVACHAGALQRRLYCVVQAFTTDIARR